MKIIFSICLLLIAYCLFAFPVHAEYVLPYPSFMPGNKLYNITRAIDKIENYWYFGTIAQTKYHLKLSDKYLVEAKTLFEYKQYLLATDALARSDLEFKALPKSKIVARAAQKHRQVLESLLLTVPPEFVWTPEKSSAIPLDLYGILSHSITLRTYGK